MTADPKWVSEKATLADIGLAIGEAMKEVRWLERSDSGSRAMRALEHLKSAASNVMLLQFQVGRGVHRNPTPPSGPLSEADAWKFVQDNARYARRGIQNRTYEWADGALQHIEGLASEMLAQVKQGVHRNPMLVTFNPPRDLHGQVKIASDVQGILYRHDKDREFYFHSFGGEEVELKNMGGGAVMIDPLPGRTGVEAFVVRNPNKRKEAVAVVMRHKDGLPIAEDL